MKFKVGDRVVLTNIAEMNKPIYSSWVSINAKNQQLLFNFMNKG